ncbi:MAG: type III-A CRISPR-associated RAMP protein Csm4 [Cryomorphaceae bacterium]|nr:type III-A CRISPR-associated RAMP protein Csm4 [Cryomorphaceae bacterium]
MQAKILKLQPNSRFHFGKSNVISRLRVEEGAEEGNGQHYFDVSASLTDTDSFLHSDVLFAALVNNLAQVKSKEAVDKFVKAFEQGTIKISSGFYCLESNFEDQQLSEYVYLFPRPVTAPNFVSIDNYDRIKQIKKVLFVCPDTLSTIPESWQLLGNIAVSAANRKRIDCEKTFVYEGDGVPEKKQRKTNFKLFSKGVATHVGLHRPNENAYGPYSVSYIQIPDYQELKLKVHFYFLYEVENQYKPDFELAGELLKYNGIGGERSTGYGQISGIDDANIPFLDKKTDEEAWMSLTHIAAIHRQFPVNTGFHFF